MRLIDADELYLGKFVEPRTEWNQGWNDALDAATTQAPAVDAVPVVHGRWITNWCDNNMICHEYEECSECGAAMLDTNQFWDCNYCPNCGAKMDGDGKI